MQQASLIIQPLLADDNENPKFPIKWNTPQNRQKIRDAEVIQKEYEQCVSKGNKNCDPGKQFGYYSIDDS